MTKNFVKKSHVEKSFKKSHSHNPHHSHEKNTDKTSHHHKKETFSEFSLEDISDLNKLDLDDSDREESEENEEDDGEEDDNEGEDEDENDGEDEGEDDGEEEDGGEDDGEEEDGGEDDGEEDEKRENTRKRNHKKPVFFAESDRAHLFKITSEIIKGFVPGICWFETTPDGLILLRGSDSKNIVSTTNKFYNFQKYRCIQKQLVGLDIQNLHRMIRSCKKKTNITLKIKNTKSDQLDLESNGVKTQIRIQRGQAVFTKDPTGYDEIPCIVPAQIFQTRFKDLLHTNVKSLKVKQKRDGSLIFECGYKLCNKSAPMGSRRETKKKIKYPVFSQEFDIKYFKNLLKVHNISHDIRIYFTPGLPIKICYDIDTHGDAVVFIKSIEQIEATTKALQESNASDFEETYYDD